MDELIKNQMDYIFFFYGLAFIFLYAATQALTRQTQRRLPWQWLGLFGLTHGVNEWLDMLVAAFGDNLQFAAVRLIVMVCSFLFLLEFGRAGMVAVTGRGVGRWI
ncbi:MAG: GGDEF domain-containing protein, partial [Deltaproteobacteria bacterium]|nr:GGDEF domain-containing protein [Deltaproteobacteria bacterium]